jgi:cellulose synthase/poly-beta-1,6-N-acetylglucosamine synthase-like glycosyltransferase
MKFGVRGKRARNSRPFNPDSSGNQDDDECQFSLARPDDLATVSRAQESLVTEGPELTLVVPTLNERDNIGPLVDLLDEVLHTVSWEVIFVDDDSPDGTAERIREIGRRDRRVRCLQRIGRRASRRPASKAHWRRPHPISPLWMPTCSTTRSSCRRCLRC